MLLTLKKLNMISIAYNFQAQDIHRVHPVNSNRLRSLLTKYARLHRVNFKSWKNICSTASRKLQSRSRTLNHYKLKFKAPWTSKVWTKQNLSSIVPPIMTEMSSLKLTTHNSTKLSSGPKPWQLQSPKPRKLQSPKACAHQESKAQTLECQRPS